MHSQCKVNTLGLPCCMPCHYLIRRYLCGFMRYYLPWAMLLTIGCMHFTCINFAWGGGGLENGKNGGDPYGFCHVFAF